MHGASCLYFDKIKIRTMKVQTLSAIVFLSSILTVNGQQITHLAIRDGKLLHRTNGRIL
jgi:hypothetical protein